MMIARVGCFIALASAASTQAVLFGDANVPVYRHPGAKVDSRPSQLRQQRIGRVTAVVQISQNCCAASAAWDRVKKLQQEYGPKGVDILVRETGPNDTFEALIHEFSPEWPPTDQSPSRPFTFAEDGGFRAGPGNCLLFGRDGFLLAADFHSNELELRLKAVCPD